MARIENEIILANYLPYLVNRVGMALAINFEADALREHQLIVAEWRLLLALSNVRRRRQIDLAELTSIDSSTLSRLITRMVRRGFVTRLRSKEDHREVSIELTPKSARIITQLKPAAQQLELIATAGLPERQISMVKDALRHIYANLAAMQDGRTRPPH